MFINWKVRGGRIWKYLSLTTCLADGGKLSTTLIVGIFRIAWCTEQARKLSTQILGQNQIICLFQQSTMHRHSLFLSLQKVVKINNNGVCRDFLGLQKVVKNCYRISVCWDVKNAWIFVWKFLCNELWGAIWPTPKSNHMLSGLTLPSQNNQTSAPIYQISIHKIIHSQKLSYETIWTSLLSPLSKKIEKQACRMQSWVMGEPFEETGFNEIGTLASSACWTFLFKNDWTLIEQFEMLFTGSGKKILLEMNLFAIRWNQGNSWLGSEEIYEKMHFLRFGIKHIW